MLSLTSCSGRSLGTVQARGVITSRPRFHHCMRLVTKAALKDTELVQLKVTGAMTELPGEPGVYAVYNAAGELQYVGLSRKVWH